MQERVPQPDCPPHKYQKVVTKGVFGEIKLIQPIPPSVVDDIVSKRIDAEKICPHGMIQCAKCHQIIYESPQSRLRVTTNNIISRLKRH